MSRSLSITVGPFLRFFQNWGTVRHLQFHALPGAETCILACRRADLAGLGTFHHMERVTLTGEPRVAGPIPLGQKYPSMSTVVS